MVVGVTVTLLAILAVVYLPGLPPPAAYALLFISGLSSGASGLCYAAAREVNLAEVTGMAIAVVNMASAITSAVFQPFIGWLLDLEWAGGMADGARVYSAGTYRIAFLAMAGWGVAGIIAALLVRETHCRPVGYRSAEEGGDDDPGNRE